jgi:hypothetical protein
METLLKILVVLALVAFVGVIVLAFNVIPWLLWNYAVAPAFGWPQVGFWQVFFICWAISWAGELIRGGWSYKAK